MNYSYRDGTCVIDKLYIFINSRCLFKDTVKITAKHISMYFQVSLFQSTFYNKRSTTPRFNITFNLLSYANVYKHKLPFSYTTDAHCSKQRAYHTGFDATHRNDAGRSAKLCTDQLRHRKPQRALFHPLMWPGHQSLLRPAVRPIRMGQWDAIYYPAGIFSLLPPDTIVRGVTRLRTRSLLWKNRHMERVPSIRLLFEGQISPSCDGTNFLKLSRDFIMIDGYMRIYIYIKDY